MFQELGIAFNCDIEFLLL